MIHLIKNSQGKLEVITVRNGNYIVGSRQGYETRAGAYGNIRAQMKSFGVGVCQFQDDTLDKPVVFSLSVKGKPVATTGKPKKKYIQSK